MAKKFHDAVDFFDNSFVHFCENEIAQRQIAFRLPRLINNVVVVLYVLLIYTYFCLQCNFIICCYIKQLFNTIKNTNNNNEKSFIY